MSSEERAVRRFRETLGRGPEIVVISPGRVNLIGDHTDYNDGFVLPMAIDRSTAIAASRRQDGTVAVESEGFGQVEFSLERLERGENSWVEYLKGVAWAIGATEGFEGVLASDIPLGASLSSSAALEVGIALTFATLSGLDWDPLEGARLSQRAENEWVGMNSGIMDQLVCAAGRADHALLIDCRTLEVDSVPLPSDVKVVVLDTGTRRRLTESRYNERRRECERAAFAFGVGALRDLTVDALEGGPVDDEVLVRRARHVVEENVRTIDGALALRNGDAPRFGELMTASHESLRLDFEVSGPALDAMVAAAQHAPGCLGARMTGGGFAGCAVALVEADSIEPFATEAVDAYRDRTGTFASVYVCEAADGAAFRRLS